MRKGREGGKEQKENIRNFKKKNNKISLYPKIIHTDIAGLAQLYVTVQLTFFQYSRLFQ